MIAGPLEEKSFDQLLEIAAAKGISFQFSTGDGGDSGLGTPVGAPGVPSNSPHATAVGGTAILNKVHGSGYERWGGATVSSRSMTVAFSIHQRTPLRGRRRRRGEHLLR